VGVCVPYHQSLSGATEIIKKNNKQNPMHAFVRSFRRPCVFFPLVEKDTVPASQSNYDYDADAPSSMFLAQPQETGMPVVAVRIGKPEPQLASTLVESHCDPLQIYLLLGIDCRVVQAANLRPILPSY
jgi:hypothetical protein